MYILTVILKRRIGVFFAARDHMLNLHMHLKQPWLQKSGKPVTCDVPGLAKKSGIPGKPGTWTPTRIYNSIVWSAI